MEKSIRWKLVRTYSVMILLILVVFTLLLLNPLQNYYRELLTEDLVTETRLVGELVANSELDARGLQQAVQKWSKEISLRITVIDGSGEVLADSHHNPQLMDNHSDRPEIARAIKGTEGQAARYSDTLKLNMLYTALPTERNNQLAVVRLAMPVSNISLILTQIKETLIAAMLAALLLGLLVSFKLASSLTKPLEEITQVAGDIANGDFEARFVPITDDEISVLGRTINYMAEILRGKVIEINQHRHKLETVLNNMVSGVMMLNSEGEVELVNKAAERELGLKGSTAVGRHNLEVMRSHRLNEEIEKILANGEVTSCEIALMYPKRQIFLVNLAPTIHDGIFNGVIAVFLDITQLRQVEQMRKDLLANVSHELGTPLTSITGFIETMQEDPDMDTAVRQRFLKIMAKETQRLNNLIDNLLELSKIESGKAYTELKKVDLARLISGVVEQMRPQAAAKAQEVIVDLPQCLFVTGDGNGLEQVVINLLDNAIKYTPKNGEISIKGYLDKDKSVISFKDTGMGIPQEALGRIFERFYRVDKARSRKQGGTGLGLAIVKHIIENHQGSISVQSKPEQGAEFIVRLPRA